MHDHPSAQRRILLQAYSRYLAADRAVQLAQSAALAWLPDATDRHMLLIGNPGSRLRRLHDRRDRALARLELARAALKATQVRSGGTQVRILRFLPAH